MLRFPNVYKKKGSYKIYKVMLVIDKKNLHKIYQAIVLYVSYDCIFCFFFCCYCNALSSNIGCLLDAVLLFYYFVI